MLKYEKLGEAIKVDLENDYEIIAMANQENEQYYMTLYLSEKNTEYFKPIFNAKNIPIDAKKSNVRGVMSSYIEEQFKLNFFDKEIESYEFEMQCFDEGIVIKEQQFLESYSNTNHEYNSGGDVNVLC